MLREDILTHQVHFDALLIAGVQRGVANLEAELKDTKQSLKITAKSLQTTSIRVHTKNMFLDKSERTLKGANQRVGELEEHVELLQSHLTHHKKVIGKHEDTAAERAAKKAAKALRVQAVVLKTEARFMATLSRREDNQDKVLAAGDYQSKFAQMPEGDQAMRKVTRRAYSPHHHHTHTHTHIHTHDPEPSAHCHSRSTARGTMYTSILARYRNRIHTRTAVGFRRTCPHPPAFSSSAWSAKHTCSRSHSLRCGLPRSPCTTEFILHGVLFVPSPDGNDHAWPGLSGLVMDGKGLHFFNLKTREAATIPYGFIHSWFGGPRSPLGECSWAFGPKKTNEDGQIVLYLRKTVDGPPVQAVQLESEAAKAVHNMLAVLFERHDRRVRTRAAWEIKEDKEEEARIEKGWVS